MNEWSANQLSRLALRGFKSIADCDITLEKLNILIGCNGAGKSNFINFFKMIQQIQEHNLQPYVTKSGGPDAILHFGRKTTEKLECELYFGNNGYRASFEATNDNQLMFQDESFFWNMGSRGWTSIGGGHLESNIDKGTKTGIDKYVAGAIKSWRVYHFHDTSDDAKVKQRHGINDNDYLRPDGSNLAAFLYSLKIEYNNDYDKIVKTVRLVAPFFGDFRLGPVKGGKDKIELEWTEKGQDIPFKAYQLSDGTLRFICLVTVLLQPEEMQPETILIDEPELGLHPYAIEVLASLLKSCSHKKQIIVSTQSVDLLSEFDVENVIVIDRKDHSSVLKKLSKKEFGSWLEDYSLGELWKKNLLGGRP